MELRMRMKMYGDLSLEMSLPKPCRKLSKSLPKQRRKLSGTKRRKKQHSCPNPCRTLAEPLPKPVRMKS